MKLASWNVNSIKARQDIVFRWLKETNIDVLMIQELKGLDFPLRDEFEALGYQISAVPQKTYNGVATLSKKEITLLKDKLPGFEEDEQARYQEMLIGGMRLINVYAPNGNPVETEKYPYKLKWLECLYTHLKNLRDAQKPFLICGDFNIIPEERDCYDPNAWKDDALFKLESREKLRQMLYLGLTDAFRVFNQEDQQYTFWDYQGGSFPANKGIRIDHFLVSPALVDQMKSCEIDAVPRGWEKPSDHTPIILELDDSK